MNINNDNNLIDCIRNNKKIVIGIISAILLIAMFIIAMYKIACTTNIKHFNSKQIEFVENKFMINLDYAEPIRYWEPKLAQDQNSRLDFYTDDYKKFMEGFYGNSIVVSSEDEASGSAKYRCYISGNQWFTVYFSKNGSRYKGELVNYSEQAPVTTTVPTLKEFSNN